VVARPGSGALIMPGPPGAGKSTLCAYLAHHGWRHMADEFCLIRPGTRAVTPFPRLIPLKNESIDVIAAVDGVRMGPRFPGTRKGTVAHVAPPDAHARCADAAMAGLVVLPVFTPDRAAEIHTLGRPELFVELSKNSFNYPVLGRSGFDTLADLVERVPAYRMRYDRLDTAANLLAELASRHLEQPETSAP
jgi:HprK-related kinase A